MSETSGAHVGDVVGGVSGQMLHDTVGMGESIIDGPFTKARRFHYNSTDDVLIINPAGDVDPQYEYEAWTVSMVIRAWQVNQWNSVLSLQPLAGLCSQSLGIDLIDWGDGIGESLFRSTFSCSSNSLVPFEDPILPATLDQWGRLTLLWDGVSLRSFYNGIPGTVVHEPVNHQPLRVVAVPWSIGGFLHDGQAIDVLYGAIADLGIWDRALSTEELQNLWAGDAPNPIVVLGGGGPDPDPDPGDTWEPLPVIPGAITLGTQIGGGDEAETTGRYNSPEYDPELDGFAGNYSARNPSAPVYPRRFLVRTPEVEAEARDPVAAEGNALYEIAIRNDELSTEV